MSHSTTASGTTRWQRRKRRLAKKKEEARAEADDAVDTDVAAGLATMPREILDEITGSIQCIRDMGAWSIATGLPTKGRHLGAIEAENVPTEDVLKAGAPLAIVEPLLALRQVKPSPELATASALGGRLDVYQRVGRGTFVDGARGFDAAGAVLPALIRRGLVDIADDIAVACSSSYMRTIHRGISHRHRVEALKEALRGSHTALARILHDHLDHYAWNECICGESVLPWILESDLPIALATLRRTGCRRAKRESRFLFARAIESGAVDVARLLAERRPENATPLVPHEASVLTAASKGHVDVLAWLYKERQYEMPAEVLGAAARAGHLGILDWAARARNGRPIASWSARYVAYAAVSGNNLGPVIEWLLTRPIDRRDLSVGVAKAALARHGIVVPLLLHNAGIAPFDTWDALEMAVDKGSTYSARVVVSNGGHCDLAVLTRCLSQHDEGMITLLADRYTSADIQTVLDSGLVGICSWAPIAWLVGNVPGLCVRDAHAIFTAPLSMGPYPDPCACARCRCPAAAATAKK
ncbi:hypothetical protein psal_cds_521 [Pandoravirus salinus]|uniref:Ankyrin repeat domain containing protein n=1 Tax=Pandoravirus salinus TaxID=1349410 RepID=S4W2D9_9VIRU|nr:hypothetical protein psal_cds_521 [Pandoravirus salinus]AGO84345.1 hypothetical protein psal_cds_521 [Pandoravirus salinus]